MIKAARGVVARAVGVKIVLEMIVIVVLVVIIVIAVVVGERCVGLPRSRVGGIDPDELMRIAAQEPADFQ